MKEPSPSGVEEKFIEAFKLYNYPEFYIYLHRYNNDSKPSPYFNQPIIRLLPTIYSRHDLYWDRNLWSYGHIDHNDLNNWECDFCKKEIDKWIRKSNFQDIRDVLNQYKESRPMSWKVFVEPKKEVVGSDRSKPELVTLCKEAGLPTTGTKADLLAQLNEANMKATIATIENIMPFTNWSKPIKGRKYYSSKLEEIDFSDVGTIYFDEFDMLWTYLKILNL